MAGRTWKIAIKKQKDRWIVEKPKGKPERGADFVEWTLHPDPDGHAVSAHIQLADMSLFTNLPGGRDLSPDMVATISEINKPLTLAVHPDACRRTNPHRYAVWIRDEKHPNGGMYAVGEDLNPPPEVNVGP